MIRTAVLVAVGALLLIAGGAVLALRSSGAHDWLAARVDAALGPRVRVGDVSFTFWPPPLAVALHDIRVLPAAASAGSDPLARADRVTVDVSFDDLLARTLVVDALSIDGAVVTVRPGSDGGFEVAGLDALPGGGDAAGGALPPALPAVTVRDGTLTVQPSTDPASALAFTAIQGELRPRPDGVAFELSAAAPDGGSLRATGTTGRLTPPSDAMPIQASIQVADINAATLASRLPIDPAPQVQGTGRATLTLTGTAAAPVADAVVELADGSLALQGWTASAPLRATAKLTWTPADGLTASAGQVTAARLAHGGVTADAAQASFDYRAGALALTGATLTACGGTWTQGGRITLAQPIVIDATLETSGVDARQLAGALQASGLSIPTPLTSAPIGLSAAIAGTVGDALTGHAALALASGTLDWDGTRLTAPAKIEADVAITSDSLRIDKGSATAQGVSAGALTAIETTLAFTVADRVLHAQALRTRIANAEWTVTGSLGLDDAAAWSATVGAARVDLAALLAALPDREPDGPSAPDGIADLDVTISGGAEHAPSGHGTLRLHAGAFVLDELRVSAPAELTTDFALRDGDLTLQNANARAARATYGPLVADDAVGSFALAGDRLTFDSLRFASCGGSWTHTGSYVLGDGGQFGGRITIAGADPKALLAMLSLHDAAIHIQRLDAQADFRGAVTPRWLDGLHANGTLTLSGGSIRHGAVLTALWDALIRRDRSADAATRENPVEQASATFALANGVCRAQSLSLRSEDYLLAGAGTIRLDGQLDLDTRITLTAAGVQHLIALGSVPLPTTRLPSLPPIPTRITGPADAMIVRPDVSSVPMATAGWLVKSVVGAPAAVGGAVVDGVDGLLQGAERMIGGRRTPRPRR